MPLKATRALLQLGGLQPDTSALTLTGADPALPSSFACGTAAQASIAAVGLAAAALHVARGGVPQTVSVDMRHAMAEFRSERYLQVNGAPPADPWDKLAGIYRTHDGWVRLHTNFPHHRDGVLKILGCANDKASVQAALLGWQAEAFEQAASDAGMVVAALRSFAEWDAHPQALALRGMPCLTLRRIGDAPPRSLPRAGRPLQDVRVLDLTRIIAGPVCGRTLAAHGADVLHVSAGHLPSIESLVMDTGRGKRGCQLDLRCEAGRETLHALIREADIFLQAYRPGGLAAQGFSPEALAERYPGIIYASLSAYGSLGPWAHKRGFDSLVQTATGFNHAEAEAFGSETPKALPAQVLDHASGYLLALGCIAALIHRAREGGSWLVEVSLVQTGSWLRSLGRPEGGIHAAEQSPADIADLLENSDSGFGTLSAIRHSARLAGTPARWQEPAVPLGSHPASW